MRSPLEDEDRPTLAFALSLVAGLLMFVEGIYLSIAASVVSSAGFVGAGDILGGLGFVGAFFGFIVILLAIFLFRNPEAHVGYGVAILVLSLLSFFGGGGFLVGVLLGVIGGILAIIYQVPGSIPLPYSSPAVGYLRPCPKCGSNLAVGASYCHTCGQAVTPEIPA